MGDGSRFSLEVRERAVRLDTPCREQRSRHGVFFSYSGLPRLAFPVISATVMRHTAVWPMQS